MDANVTAISPQSEPDHDNSSLQNPSTNPAEAGTADETSRDEDHETSSIEALNWSEVEEEELAAAQKAESAAQGKQHLEANVNGNDQTEDNMTNNGSSLTDEGSLLSTTLLQSIDSSVSDEDPQARKLSVIENWASEVTNAVERGEIEMTEDFPEENGTTGDEGELDAAGKGIRKRKGKKCTADTISSKASSASHGESIGDPLSNAPVLDDGPIWNKGPRSYTFQPRTTFNQKLTFCLLIAVVLAIGLGLGNLVAHQECEAEYKATQPSSPQITDKISVHTVPTPTTPAPIIPDKSTDSSMLKSSLPMKQSKSTVDSNEEKTIEDVSASQNKRQINDNNNNIVMEDRPRKRDDPIIDPKYKIHAATVSSVVHTLDKLSRKIDQFENTTRKLQGVLMIPEEESENSKDDTLTDSLFDEVVHTGDDENNKVYEEIILDDEEDEMEIIDELIDAIEQTPDFLEQKSNEKKLKKWEELDKNEEPSKIFDAEVPEDYPGKGKDIELMLKSIQQFKDFHRRFIKSERKRLREEGKYNKNSWRLPKEYTVEEKNALKVRYRTNWADFLKLAKNKIPDPIEALFGVEEDEEERTYEDAFHFPDPEDDLSPEEYSEQFRHLEELQLLGKNLHISTPDKVEQVDDQSSFETVAAPKVKKIQPTTEERDDLVITDDVDEELQHPDYLAFDANNQHEKLVDSDPIQAENIVGESKRKDKFIRRESPLQTENEINRRPVTEGSKLTKEKRDAVDTEPHLVEAKVVTEKSNDFSSKHYTKGTVNQGSSNEIPATKQSVKRHQKQKELPSRQTKQKGGNVSNSNYGSKDHSTHKNNLNDLPKSEKKASGKNKKVKNAESNKVFENVKGKNVDKRRRASPDTPRNEKFGRNANDLDNSAGNSNEKFLAASTNKKDERGHDETLNSYNRQQSLKQAKNHEATDNRKNENNAANYKKSKVNDPKQNERKNMKEHQRQQQHDKSNDKNRRDFSSERRSAKLNSQEYKDASKDSKFRRQENDYNQRQEPRNTNYESGKKSKTWQSTEKVDRREKLRDRGSSWGI